MSETNECTRPTIGLYVDRGREWLEAVHGDLATAARAIRELGFDVVTVEVRGQLGSDGKRRLKWSVEDVVALGEAADDAGLLLRLMWWPDGEFVGDLLMEIWRYMGALQRADLAWVLDAVTLDLEGRAPRWGGVSAIDAAGLGHMIPRVITTSTTGIGNMVPRLVTTTHMGRDDGDNTEAIMALTDVATIQAYSARHKLDRQWGEKHGPGNMQRAALADLRDSVPPGHPVGLDLPLFGQDYPGHGIEAAMREAAHAAVEGGALEVHYWSVKWLWRGEDDPDEVEYSAEVRRVFEALWGRA